jgi:exosome complex component RRP4
MQSAYVEDGKTYASMVALFDREKGSVVPLEGAWVPRIDDLVVGTIEDCRNHVYTVELLYYNRGLIIEGKYERHPLNIGDVVEATIKNIEDRKTVILSYPKALPGGVVVTVKPSKVPRIIGKADTMIRQIAEITRTRISVGNNGVVWLSGPNAAVAMHAIAVIESEAQAGGLTERIKGMLENEMKGRPDRPGQEQKKGV